MNFHEDLIKSSVINCSGIADSLWPTRQGFLVHGAYIYSILLLALNIQLEQSWSTGQTMGRKNKRREREQKEGTVIETPGEPLHSKQEERRDEKVNRDSSTNTSQVTKSKLKEKSRIVYVSTACHTCKAIPVNGADNLKLSLCAGCRMVNYCSREHQVADWKSHKPLCVLIERTRKFEQKSHLYEGCQENLSQTEWLQIRYGYMQLFRDQLGRDLYPYEKEILLFPRVCRVCHSTDALQTCKKCNVSTSCIHHQTEEHDWCSDLKVWLDLVRWENENGLARPSPEISFASRNFPSDIQTFFQGQLDGFGLGSEDVYLAGITDVATIPLTIIWAIKEFAAELGEAETLTLHLIGAEMNFEGCCEVKWETCFLHLLQPLQRLNVILIGPELASNATKHNLCQQCDKRNRQVVIQHHPGVMYHEYYEWDEFLKPDIVCAFNCGIYRNTGFEGEDSWAPTVPLLGKSLLVTTAYTQTECFQDITRILTECRELELQASLKNSFRSLRPQRTLINEKSEPLMYKNQYAAVFKPPSVN